MKYQIEYHPNPNCVTVHVDKRVVVGKQGFFSCRFASGEETPNLARHLLDVHGVEEVHLGKYDVQLTKGVVFKWEDMFKQIVAIIDLDLNPEGKVEESAPPIRYYIDGAGYRQELKEGEVPPKITRRQNPLADWDLI